MANDILWMVRSRRSARIARNFAAIFSTSVLALSSSYFFNIFFLAAGDWGKVIAAAANMVLSFAFIYGCAFVIAGSYARISGMSMRRITDFKMIDVI